MLLLLLLLLARQNVCTLHSLFFVFFCSSLYSTWCCCLSVICVESYKHLRRSIPQNANTVTEAHPALFPFVFVTKLPLIPRRSAKDQQKTVTVAWGAMGGLIF